MSKKARSARGEIVDFDLLSIKQQLATAPVPVSVNQRRKFIDEKDGIRATKAVVATEEVVETAPSALSMALQGAAESAEAAEE